MTRKRYAEPALADGLAPEVLRSACDPKDLGFATTEALTPSRNLIGQDRAVDAIKLSAGIGHKGFNVFVMGNEGTGRHTVVKELLSKAALGRPAPSDWVYVNNFDTPHKPNAMRLPPGFASVLRTAMQDLVDDLANEIPTLFESEEYQTQRRAIEEEFGEKHEDPIADFAERIKKENVALLRTHTGFMLAAIIDGKPIEPEVYEALTEKNREDIDSKIERLEKDLSEILKNGPELEKAHRQKIGALHAAMAERVVSLRVKEVVEKFSENLGIIAYLGQVREDMIANAELFLMVSNEADESPFPAAIRKFHRDPEFDRYAVNIMVSQKAKGQVAPVVTENQPSPSQLTGRIEYVSEMGALETNFTLIKPGALHSANGGFLILDAHQLLSEPFAWDALKRCLQSQSIQIASLAERLGIASTITLDPGPIPLDVRVVLIGDRQLYLQLLLLDPEFGELFKVQADFEDDLSRSAKATRQMAEVIASHAVRENLHPLTAAAVAALLDHAVRLAGDSKKFSLQFGALTDLMCEADHYSKQAKRKVIAGADVHSAIQQAERRASRIKDRLQEAVTRKTILIDTTGKVVGQVNGLTVIGVGNHLFGQTLRITARVRMGAGQLVDIEREVELGGPLHSKGVLILGSYLAARYALDVPISLHASLVFEQSYGGVEGDSASSAELYALLSAVSGVPIRQGLAVTGSVSQNGEVQAIGGVNEKIEGFFDLCKARRLSGRQGVLIPASNVDSLMLRQDVVDAAAAGTFRVIPITTIDQGIEVLTGRVAGKRDHSGNFPDGSINALVESQLRLFAGIRRRFSNADGETGNAGAQP